MDAQHRHPLQEGTEQNVLAEDTQTLQYVQMIPADLLPFCTSQGSVLRGSMWMDQGLEVSNLNALLRIAS